MKSKIFVYLIFLVVSTILTYNFLIAANSLDGNSNRSSVLKSVLILSNGSSEIENLLKSYGYSVSSYSFNDIKHIPPNYDIFMVDLSYGYVSLDVLEDVAKIFLYSGKPVVFIDINGLKVKYLKDLFSKVLANKRYALKLVTESLDTVDITYVSTEEGNIDTYYNGEIVYIYILKLMGDDYRYPSIYIYSSDFPGAPIDEVYTHLILYMNDMVGR